MTLKSLPNHLSKRARLDKVIIYLSKSKVLIESKKIWYEKKHNEILDVDYDLWPNDGEVITQTYPECIKCLNEKDKEKILCWYWPTDEKLPAIRPRGFCDNNKISFTCKNYFDSMMISLRDKGYLEVEI